MVVHSYATLERMSEQSVTEDSIESDTIKSAIVSSLMPLNAQHMYKSSLKLNVHIIKID